MTHLKMYMDILNKYGDHSPQLKKWVKFYHQYSSHRKILFKYYSLLMEENK